jgi:hypothetical protein
MKLFIKSFVLILGLAAFVWLGNGQTLASLSDLLVTNAEARLGRPATPVSYAGVARRSTVRVATPGVGAGGVGGPASGIGVRPGAGAGRAGVGANAGGPVNRVGVR